MAGRWRVFGLIGAALLVGCGTSHRASLRISGEDAIGPVLSRADVPSARVEVDPVTSHPYVDLVLTPSGGKKLLDLATNLSNTGRRRHHPLHMLISVNRKVISQQEVGYDKNGNPVPGPPKGILVDVASFRAARDLAARLNR